MPTRLAVLALLSLALTSAAAPAPFLAPRRASLPVGRWIVRFENGVVQTCTVQPNGAAHVVEPARNAAGRASVNGGSAVIVSKDDRIERWTKVGGVMRVEHWFPASSYPAGVPARGVASFARP
jgi:hypothetical protein